MIRAMETYLPRPKCPACNDTRTIRYGADSVDCPLRDEPVAPVPDDVRQRIWERVEAELIAPADVDCEPLSEPASMHWWQGALLVAGVIGSALVMIAVAVGLIYGLWAVLS